MYFRMNCVRASLGQVRSRSDCHGLLIRKKAGIAAIYVSAVSVDAIYQTGVGNDAEAAFPSGSSPTFV